MMMMAYEKKIINLEDIVIVDKNGITSMVCFIFVLKF